MNINDRLDAGRDLRGVMGALRALHDPLGRGKELHEERDAPGMEDYKNPIRRFLSEVWEDYESGQPDFWEDQYGVDTKHDWRRLPDHEKQRRLRSVHDEMDVSKQGMLGDQETEDIDDRFDDRRDFERGLLDDKRANDMAIGDYTANKIRENPSIQGFSAGGANAYKTPPPRGAEVDPVNTPEPIGGSIEKAVNNYLGTSPIYANSFRYDPASDSMLFDRDSAISHLQRLYPDPDGGEIEWDKISDYELEQAVVAEAFGDPEAFVEKVRTQVLGDIGYTEENRQMVEENITPETVQAYLPGGTSRLNIEEYLRDVEDEGNTAGDASLQLTSNQRNGITQDEMPLAQKYQEYRDLLSQTGARPDTGLMEKVSRMYNIGSMGSDWINESLTALANAIAEIRNRMEID